MEKQTKKQLFWEIFRFLLVGGTATIVDYLVHALFEGAILPLFLDDAGWKTLIATALGFCAGLAVNWILSVTFVFRQVKNEREARSKKGFAIFAIIGVIGLGITELGVFALVKLIPTFALFGVGEFLGVAWATWVARVAMTCIVLVWNYLGRKIFVFKS